MKLKFFARSLILFFTLVFVLSFTFGCAGDAGRGENLFNSYKEIPGVTDEDVAAIEKLKNVFGEFVYAVNYSSEAFTGESGEVAGFAALFGGWLSDLFGIDFVPRIVEWDELIDGLEDGSVDFTGELTANYERREKYFMTDDIAQRQVICVRLENGAPFGDIERERPLRFAFLEDSTTYGMVKRNERGGFEEFFVESYFSAYEMLASGEADAFYCESSAEGAFDVIGGVSVTNYFPITYSPVSLSTGNAELRPFIDAVQKALDAGAIKELTRLYNRGRDDYLKQKLFLMLTEEEREYVNSKPVVPFAAEIANYPVSFCDSHTGEWGGVAHDVLNEIEKLTGIRFERVNDEKTHWPELLKMLENGEVSVLSELIQIEERVGKFLWPDEYFFRDYVALISKAEFRDININEILYARTGVAKDTAYSSLIREWFPNHRYVIEYHDTLSAFDALERGEIDMVMTSEHQLLILTNYRELVGYKANFIFDYYFESTFGFNVGEEVLVSVVSKAMRLADVAGISSRWMKKTYDYRIRLERERIPFIVGVAMLSLGLVYAVVLFLKTRKEGMNLEVLIETRTIELLKSKRKLEEMLQQNEYQLLKHNLMVKATKIALWDMEIINPESYSAENKIIWSDEFKRMLGFTDETDFPNVLGSWTERIHPDDKDATLGALLSHLLDKTGATPFDAEFRLKLKSGEYAFFRASGETVRDGEGNAVSVAGSLLDITETKKLLLDLEAETSTFRTMFDSVPDLLFCKDTELLYTRCNESLLKYFNLKEDEIVGKDDAEGLKLPDDVAQSFREMDRSVINEQKIIRYEEYVPSPDGSRRLFETNKVPLFINGEVAGIMGIARDVTERKSMEEAAQSANKAKTEFLANMSHEIRTPMNAILGMSEILKHEDLNPRQMSYVGDIHSSAHSLLDIINDILDMSKIEAGKLALKPVDYNFNQFIDKFVSVFTHIAGNKHLEFIYETSGDIPDYLYGDDIRLRQILTNICGNALKFTEKGYIKLTINKIEADKLVFTIEDTGAGIHKDDLPKLFNAFEQIESKKSRYVAGTGLGLPICKSFIEMMDGEIAVESVYGRGTVFTITLPIIKGSPESIAELEAAEAKPMISAPGARVLVTDDNEFNLKVAMGLLAMMQIQTETAHSGDAAIELIKRKDFDIVFMDHMMPMKDGVETVREIRAMGGKFESITIIALTANAVKGVREMFFENGFDDFIAKPIDTGELGEIIKKHLPAGMIKTETGSDAKLAREKSEEELFGKAAVIFAKANKTTAKNLAESLNAGDIKTAHRIAHTLKSSAGYFGKTELREAAFALEHSLQHGQPDYTAEQLRDVERELAKTLREFEPLLIKMESGKPAPVEISGEELKNLFAELVPLLEMGDIAASDYAERLHGVEGMSELAERIDDYDFEGALKIIKSLS